ncbi:MAG: hypothetical protein IPK64_05530 [bacterium]|nr:hypothetical protein [bacterium]
MSRRLRGPQQATLALLVVAALAAAFLWSTRSAPRGGPPALGGPLLPPSSSPVDALLVNVRGQSYRLERLPGGAWTLGGALADDVDQRAMAALVDTLLAAAGGPLLPGTEPGDRRYEFNGPDGLQVVVRRADGTTVDFALGVVNPVTGTRYATGAGRRFCFTVPMSLRDRLAALPDAVRARAILPGVDPLAVQRVSIAGDGAVHRLVRRDGAWWLAAPADISPLGPLSARYQALYGDRRRLDADGAWLLASTVAVRRLVHDVGQTAIRELAPPAQAAELAERWQLTPPWRRVTISGAGLRPHLMGTSGGLDTTATVDFGPPLDATRAPAARRGHVLVVGREAVETLQKPTGALLELGALPVPALAADLVEVVWEGRPLLRGARLGQPDANDGRRAWLAELPTAEGWPGSDADRHGLVRDLVVNLERQQITEVLPPHPEPSPLREDGLAILTVTFGTGAGASRYERQIGWLREPTAAARAAVWDPRTGQLLGIPDDLPVTMRNAAELVAPRR